MYTWALSRYVATDVMTPLDDASLEIWYCRSWGTTSMKRWSRASSLGTRLDRKSQTWIGWCPTTMGSTSRVHRRLPLPIHGGKVL